MNDDKDNKKKLTQPSDKPPKPKSRIHTTEAPFTLHIDDTPENVARALLGRPLKRD